MRVLLVEDYAPLRESVSQAIEEAGYAVDAAGDGEVGLWHAQSGEYDAIVLDVMLPKLDGLSILKRLRQAGDCTATLLLTAKDTVARRTIRPTVSTSISLTRMTGSASSYFRRSSARTSNTSCT